MKSKQLDKGIRQLIDEGVFSFFQQPGNRKLLGRWSFQFEVINYRLTHEYGAKCQFVQKLFQSMLITTDNEEQLESFAKANTSIGKR